MKIQKKLISMTILNPLFIGGDLWIDHINLGYLRGRGEVFLENIEAGVYTLSFNTENGTLKNTFTTCNDGVHTIHLAHDFKKMELEYRFKEASDLLISHSNLDRLKELVGISSLIKEKSFESGKTLLHMSVDSLYYEGTSLLVEAGACVNSADKFGTTPLMSAVEKSDIDLVRLLIKNGARVNHRDCHNENALMKGITNHKDSIEIFKLLQSKDIETDVQSNVSGLTPLLKTFTKKEYSPITSLFLEEGEDEPLLLKDSRGYTSLDLALIGKNIEGISFLINKKLLPSTPTSIYRAIDTRDTSIITYVIDYFIKNNLDLNITIDGGITPLMYACSIGYLDGVKLLLDYKINVHKKDLDGETALFYSLYYPNVCSLLIDSGANVKDKNLKGETPFIKLIPKKYRDTANLLI